jgi:hypothetical protein
MPNFTKLEAPNHTPEQVGDYFDQAVQIMRGRDCPEPFDGQVLAALLTLLGQKSVVFIPEQTASPLDLNRIIGRV